MLQKLIVWFTVTGLTYSAENPCNNETANSCYDELNDYYLNLFPLYGADEAKLNENCGRIQASLNCIKSYEKQCNNESLLFYSDTRAKCDDNCTTLVSNIQYFFKYQAFVELTKNLCDKENDLRKTYLENADCLENTADYAMCHDIIQKTDKHIVYLIEIRKNHPQTEKESNAFECCFASWFRDCFTEKTRRSCGKNASDTISSFIDLRYSYFPPNLCSSVLFPCYSPPFPANETTLYYNELNGTSLEGENSSGVTYIDGNSCDSENARSCYNDLMSYHHTLFPLYGACEVELDQNCGKLHASVNCIKSYEKHCNNESLLYYSDTRAKCDDNCTALLSKIKWFFKNGGLVKLAKKLCDKENDLRKTFLENADCLENTADYTMCHNIIKKILKHRVNLKEIRKNVPKTREEKKVSYCCYAGWFRDCFTEETRRSCGENASATISSFIDLRYSYFPPNMCSSVLFPCYSPPFPANETTLYYNEINGTSLEGENSSGFTNVIGNPCSIDLARSCYDELMSYRNTYFQIYKEGEAKLDEHCGKIHASTNCIKSYEKHCNKESLLFYSDSRAKCDDNCNTLVSNIQKFLKNQAIMIHIEMYCNKESETRKSLLIAYRNMCDSEIAKPCYDELMIYDLTLFPLFGADEAKLDENCGKIDASTNCIKKYERYCNKENIMYLSDFGFKCDDNCTTLVSDIRYLLKNQGILKLAEILCDKESDLRKTYLQNADCIENTADYTVCHDIVHKTLKHVAYYKEIPENDPQKLKEWTRLNCCVIFMVRDCFTSETKSSCGESASVTLSNFLDYRYSSYPPDMCSRVSVPCYNHPLIGNETAIYYEVQNRITRAVKNSSVSIANSIGDLLSTLSPDLSLRGSETNKVSADIPSAKYIPNKATANLFHSFIIVLPYLFSKLFNTVLRFC